MLKIHRIQAGPDADRDEKRRRIFRGIHKDIALLMYYNDLQYW